MATARHGGSTPPGSSRRRHLRVWSASGGARRAWRPLRIGVDCLAAGTRGRHGPAPVYPSHRYRSKRRIRLDGARQKRSTERPSRANGGVRGARALACAVLQPVGRLGGGRGVAADWRWRCGTDAAAHALHPACFISVRRALSGDAGGDARLGRLDLGRRARERAPRAARGSAAPRGRALRHAGPRQLHRARRWRCAPPLHTARAAAGDARCERQHAHQPPPREQFDAPRCPRGRGSAGGVAQGALLRIGGAGRGLAHLGRAWDTLQSWSSVAWVVWGNTIDRQCHESANETLRYVPGCQGVETTQEVLPLQAVVRAHGAWRGAASRARDARYCWAGGC